MIHWNEIPIVVAPCRRYGPSVCLVFCISKIACSLSMSRGIRVFEIVGELECTKDFTCPKAFNLFSGQR